MKSILKSKVFWLAIIQGSIGVITVLISSYPDVGTLLILKSLLDVVLRYQTTTQIVRSTSEPIG